VRRPNSTSLRIAFDCSLFALLLFPCVHVASQQHEDSSELVSEFKGSQYFWQQLEVAQKLVALNDSMDLPHLEPYLKSKDRHLRGNAAFVFAGLGKEVGLMTIYEILRDRSSPRPEGQGVPTAPWSIEVQIIEDRYYAVHLLGLLKNPKAMPVLVPLLKDKDVNYKVAWALGEIGDRAAIPALLNALQDRSPDMRVASIDALVTLRATNALPKLRLLLKDNERIHTGKLNTVSESASLAIAKLHAIR
jgi:HEAT repeat protein